MSLIKIYILIDPRNGHVRYVGKTNNPLKRLSKHISVAKKSTKSHKNAWIKGLLNDNFKPILEVIDEIDEKDWIFWEVYWISQFKTWSFNLLNVMSGGEGVSIGTIPWNKGSIGVMKSNSATWKKGQHVSIRTQWKKGIRNNISGEWKIGHLSPRSIKIKLLTLDGVFFKEFNSYTDAAKYIGVAQSAITNCIRRKTFKCKNFIIKICTTEL